MLAFVAVSWLVSLESNFTLWIIGWLLALPLILSVFVGKGFAKPECWSSDHACPGLLATRPISCDDIVFIKLKVAALSTVLAWLPVILFHFVWLAGWADTRRTESLWWLARANVPLPELCAILGLTFFALLLLTWRNMVRSLWAGLSGKKFLYVASFVLDVIGGAFFIGGAIWLGESHDNWLNQPAAAAFWIGCVICVVVLLKLFAAACFWKNVNPVRSGLFALIWLVGTLCFAALAWLICQEVPWLRHLLVLAALLAVPLARLGLTTTALAKNRHR
jgi:hypothetical protein